MNKLMTIKDITKAGAQQLIEKAHTVEKNLNARRIELNNGWTPDFLDEYEPKVYIYPYKNILYDSLEIDSGVYYSFERAPYPLFGYFKNYKIAERFIRENKEKLEWYFFEYIPIKDELDMLLIEDLQFEPDEVTLVDLTRMWKNGEMSHLEVKQRYQNMKIEPTLYNEDGELCTDNWYGYTWKEVKINNGFSDEDIMHFKAIAGGVPC